MNHKDLVSAAAVSMAMAGAGNPTPKELEEERVEEMRQKEVDDKTFIIDIPLITGRVFKVDAREVDWNSLGTPESQANLENNEGTIRSMMHALVTADFSDPETEKMISEFDESIMNLFSNFGISDPGYDEMMKKTMVRPYVLLLGKCFDALTLINVIAHNTAMHGLATQVFGIVDNFNKVADLNDITEMNNSTNGLITEDREIFEEDSEDEDDE